MGKKKLALIISATMLSGLVPSSVATATISNNKTPIVNQKNKEVEIDKNESSDEQKLLEKQNNISMNNITINNVWSQNIGTISFNSTTQKMQFEGGWAESNPYLPSNAQAFSIKVYNKLGKLTQNVVVDGSESFNTIANAMYKAFNNVSYEYGDLIEIDYKTSSKISISNFNGQTSYNITKPILLEINENGLKAVQNQLTVNPFDILESGNNTGNLTGTAPSGATVTANIDGKIYTGIAKNGSFNIKISDVENLKQSSLISVTAPECVETYIYPTISSNIKIGNNNIIINNSSNQNMGTLSFNPITQKIQFKSGWAAVSSNISAISQVFSINLYNKSGELIKSVPVYGGESFNTFVNAMTNAFNNIDYQYGDYIEINYKTSSNINISNFDGQAMYQVTKPIIAKITKGGLEVVQRKLVVNPFEVLTGNDVNSGIITGKAPIGNKIVVTIGNQKFTGVSNSEGVYNIKINNSAVFTPSTQINVWSKGCIATTLNPTAPTNLGINNTQLKLKNGSLGMSQVMTFNPNTMTINNFGNSFGVQLLDSKTGKVLASQGTGNFNVFNSSNNNIDGAKFQYGDVVNIYETQETYLSDGDVILVNGKNETALNNAVEGFESFEITPNGLVPVQNKNLNNLSAMYEGNNNVVVTATITPNTNATLYYGNNLSEVVKSDSKGKISVNLPFSELGLGTEVRLFTNNQNNKGVLVSYNSKIFNTKDSIQIVNNEAFPVINIKFSPITNTISTMIYPIDKTYAGVFYGNKMNISLLNGQTGNIIKSVTSAKQGEIITFANQLNNLKYNQGDIIKIEYDKNFVSANVLDNKKEIGNSTGQTEYFEITNKGLVNVTNKFIQVNPLEILGEGNITSTTIKGNISPNTDISAIIDGKVFTGKSDSSGNFNLEIEDAKGFLETTNIILSAEGYIPTTVNPKVNSTIGLSNSYINFYINNSSSWEYTDICSSIGFNVVNNTFNVNNYSNNFGQGNSTYFTLSLYNNDGTQIMSKSFNTGENTSELANFINGKSYTYGDVIGLQYNVINYRPVVLNGNNTIGNINGEVEYFKITKIGLERVADSNGTPFNTNNNLDNTSEVLGKYINITEPTQIASYLTSIKENLSSVNLTNLSEDNQNKILAAEFIDRIGVSNLENIYNQSEANAKFINWVLNNSIAMQEFLGGPNPECVPEGQPPAPYSACLQVWSNIWNTYQNSHSGFNLKLAIAVSLTNGAPIPSFPSGQSVGSPVQRYNIFETLNAGGGMMPVFSTLDVSHLCYVTNTIIANDQIEQMRSIILQNHNGLIKNNGTFHDIAFTINYNTRNPHTGASVFGNDFYGPNPTINDVWYDGGVCGATGRMGATGEQVFGIPAVQTPQPGHNCFMYYEPLNNTWNLGNNIVGWAGTYDADMSSWSAKIAPNTTVASYNLLYQAADTKALAESNTYVYLANSQSNYDSKLAALNKAIAIQPLNLGAWIEKVNLYKSNQDLTGSQYIQLANEIMSTFKDYPMPMYDLILQMKNQLLQLNTTLTFNNLVKSLTNTLKASKGPSDVVNAMLSQMTTDGFVINQEKSQGEIYLNNYGIQNTVNVAFVNGKISVTGQNKEIGTNNSDSLEINLYNSQGKFIKGSVATGNIEGSSFGTSLNGQTYNVGDYITVSYKTGTGSDSTLGFMSSNLENTNINGSMILKVTNSGIKPVYENKVQIGDSYYGIMAGQLMNLNSSVLTVNSWPYNHITGTTMNLIFNNNKIIANATWKWLGAKADNYLDISIYTSTGTIIKNYSFAGNEYAYIAGENINGQTYSNGDIIVLNNTLEENGVANNKVSLDVGGAGDKKLKGKIAYKITNNQLVPINGAATINGISHIFEDGIEIIKPQVQAQNNITLNSWNTKNVLSISLKNNSLEAIGEHKWIGTATESQLGLSLYSSNGDKYQDYKWNGEEFGDNIANVLNGIKYTNDSIMMLTTKFPYSKTSYGSNTHITEKGASETATDLNLDGQYGYEIIDNQLEPINGVKNLNGVAYEFQKGVVIGIVNKDDLINEINIVKVMNTTGYTTKSVATLQSSLKNAQVIATNEESTISDVSNSLKVLQNAIKGLVVNKENLIKEINVAKKINTKGYTSKSIEILENSLKNAEIIAGNKDATVNEVTNSLIALQNATNGLIVDLNGLINEINTVKAININEYTPQSIKVFQNALKNAQGVLQDKDITVSKVTNSLTELKKAVKSLKLNKGGLTKEINIAKEINTNGYTPESIKTLQDALKNAEIVDANSKSTEKEITNALTQLQNAVKSLVVSFANLKDEINIVKGMHTTGYTPQSIKALQDALQNAEIVAKNSAATPKEVTSALIGLQNAVKRLVVDFGGLVNEINTAKAVDTNGYTPESINALQNALQNAETIATNSKSTEREVTNALTQLQNAMNKLATNKDGLTKEINKAKAIDTRNETSQNVASLHNAIKNAETVVQNSAATEIEISNAVAEVQNAVDGLQENNNVGILHLSINGKDLKNTQVIYSINDGEDSIGKTNSLGNIKIEHIGKNGQQVEITTKVDGYKPVKTKGTIENQVIKMQNANISEAKDDGFKGLDYLEVTLLGFSITAIIVGGIFIAIRRKKF